MRHTNHTAARLQSALKQKTMLSHVAGITALILLQSSTGIALPVGGQVEAGQMSVSQPDPTRMVINHSTEQAIVNWQSFDIQGNESTQVIQPSTRSAALYRIKGGNGNATQILGQLSANGNLMLVNPNGVFFGAGSRVDVGSLIVSSADIRNDDFLAGNMKLSTPGRADASIINQGSITAAQGGLVALVAPNVRNDGVIQANLGTVALAAGETASIDFYGDNLYGFAVDGAGAQVANTGSISGAKVLLTANAAKSVIDNAINNTGIIEATNAYMDGGDIVLDAGAGNVNLASTSVIDASGKNGGGNVNVTGGTVKAAAGSKIDVSAKDTGNGGTAAVLSKNATSYNGILLGTGGANGGNGGHAEISSEGSLGFGGFANLSASNGAKGSLLLDPGDLFIGAAGDFSVGGDDFIRSTSIASTLDSGTDVTSIAVNDIEVQTAVSWSGTGAWTLDAGNDIRLNADITSTTGAGAGSEGALTLNAGNNIALNNANVATNKGNIALNGVDVTLTNSSITGVQTGVNINNSGVFSSNTANAISALGSVALRQSAAGSIQNAIDAIGNAGTSRLDLGTGTWIEQVSINQNNFTLQGNGVANTTIQAPALATNPVIGINNAHSVTLNGFTVDGGTTGINIINSDSSNVTGVNVTNALAAGITLNNTSNAIIGGTLGTPSENNITGSAVGILSQNSVLNQVQGNNFNNNVVGMVMTGDSPFYLGDNAFNGGTTGILMNNVIGAPIVNNTFTGQTNGIIATGGGSLVLDNNTFTGNVNNITTNGVVGLNITNNSIAGGNTGINVVGGFGVSVRDNTINNANTAINAQNVGTLSVTGNTITNANDGVIINGGFNTLVDDNDINSSTNGVTLSNGFNVELTDNRINTLFNGISITNTGLFWVLGNEIDGTTSAISLTNTTNGTIGRTAAGDGNTLTNNLVGIESVNGNMNAVQGNTFTDNTIAARFTGDQNLFLDSNTVTGGTKGFVLTNVVGAPVTNNTLTGMSLAIEASGGNSLSINNNTIGKVTNGIYADGVTGLTVMGNTITNVSNIGIAVSNGLVNTSIHSNTLDGFTTGILMTGSVNGSILDNTVSNGTGDGIQVGGSTSTLIQGNTVSNTQNGIHLTPGNVNTLIANNSVSDSDIGIQVENATGLTLQNNTLTGNVIGGSVKNSDVVRVEGNVFENNTTGLAVRDSTGVSLFSNAFNTNYTGLLLIRSDNITVSTDTFNLNTVGVEISDSQNTRLEELTIVNGATGIRIMDGSGGTIVRGLTLTGGNIGIYIRDFGSSMQFESNTSSMASVNNYFILENNAMLGDTLIATQQTFDGIRAADFTEPQRDAAEGITTDVEDLPGRGDVFYKDFPREPEEPEFPTDGGPQVFNDFLRFREDPYREGLFSYSGRTITNNLAETPFTFQIDALNLSLLNPNPGVGAPVAINVAALNTGDLGNLSPAAGGNNPEALATLSPAAGSNAGQATCVNNYLDTGYDTGFNPQTCTVEAAPQQ